MNRPLNFFRVAVLVPLAVVATAVSQARQYSAPLVEYVIEYVQTLATLIYENPSTPFLLLFIFRYLRLLVHLFSFWILYKPAPTPANPKYDRNDCTVIVPTVDPGNPYFRHCILLCLYNAPAHIIIVTVGQENVAQCLQTIGVYLQQGFTTKIEILDCPIANKRQQIVYALPHVTTDIVVLLDDHVFWQSPNFLPTVLAPFENPKVGGVGTNKRVRRNDRGFHLGSFWNMIGAIYLERHNFEIRATNAIDGGVFVISGRTAAYRTEILSDTAFINGFINETFLLGMCGPLNADDDNFITRWLVRHGYDIKIQYCDDALIETTLGTYPKFLSQCLRWSRTTWRSNLASLITDRTVWRRQPWCLYAVYITSLVNFALFYDSALFYTLSMSPYGNETTLKALGCWIFFTKMIKLTPYFLRHPRDLLMLPGYFVFAYFHSFLKLYAGLTFWNTHWAGRNLDQNNVSPADNDDDPSYDGDDDDEDEYEDDNSDDDDRGYDGDDEGENNYDYDDYDDYNDDDDNDDERESRNEYLMRWIEESASIATKPEPSDYNTPWGQVSTSSPHTTPANVRQVDCCSSRATTRVGTNKSAKKNAAKREPTYSRTWQRYPTCYQLHSSVNPTYQKPVRAAAAAARAGQNNRCLVPSTFGLPRYTVPTRPRF